MSTWNGFPRDSSSWIKSIEKTYERVEAVLARCVWNKKKLTLISTELASFKNKFSQIKGSLNNDQILRCFEFLKTTTAFLGIISNYQEKNWLTYFLTHDLNKPYNDLAFLWSAWTEISMAFCFRSFEAVDALPAAHSHDLIRTYQLLVENLKSFPKFLYKPIISKLNKIKELLDPSVKPGCIKDEENKNILKHRDWDITDEAIGQGGYAVVHLAKLKSTGEDLAIKELKAVNLKPKTVGYLKREIDSMLHLNHPNLLKLAGVTITQPFCIATGFLPNGDLFDILHGKNEKTMKKPMLLSQIAVDVARGLEYLHASHMVHRDLKPPNILMTKDWRAVICDFGLTRFIGPNMTIELGTAQWMAPELLVPGSQYDGCVDVYAYGILLWELYTQKMPYERMKMMQIIIGVLNQKLRPEIPKDAEPKYKKLITSCWAQKMKDRPTMHQVRVLLETGDLIVPGTDKAKFKEWCKKTAPEHKAVMDKFYKEKHDPQTLIKQLKSLSLLDPQVQTTLQQIIEAKIFSVDILDRIVTLIEHCPSPMVQALSMEIVNLMIDEGKIDPDRIMMAVIRDWADHPDFVVQATKKLASKIKKRSDLLKQILASSQPPETIDMIVLIATEEDVNFVLQMLSKSHIMPVLAHFVEKFGPSKIMLQAAVSSINAIAYMIRVVLQKKMLTLLDIPQSDQMEKSLQSVLFKLSTNTYANTEKDAYECIRMLAPMMRAAGKGLGTLEILNNSARFSKIAQTICELQLWGAIFGGFTSTDTEMLNSTIELVHILPLAPSIYQQGWELIVNNYNITHSEGVLKLIKEILMKDQQFDVSDLVVALFNSVGKITKKNVDMLQFILSINYEQHKFTMKRNFTDMFTNLIHHTDYNVPMALAIFVLQYISRIGLTGIDDEIFGASLSFLYNGKPPFDAVLPVLQILLIATSSTDHAAFMVKNGFADYLSELPLLYPKDPRVVSIIPLFCEALKKSVPQ